MAQRKKKHNSLAVLILCLILIMAAVFGGFALANSIRNSGRDKGTDKTANDGNNGMNIGEGIGKTGMDQGGKAGTYQGVKTAVDDSSNGKNGSGTMVLSKTPVEIIYDVNFETGRIEEILVGILRTAEGRIDYLRIDTDVMYTMSASLYTSLTPDNTTLPQTVTFSELYRYYHNDKAFDAGRQVISEMLSFNIFYYSAMPDHDFEKLFSIKEYDEEIDIDYAVRPSDVKSDHGTAGSTKGFIEEILGETVTNWSIDDRLRYLETLDELNYDNVTFTDAPIYEMNESCRLDTEATGRILYDIIY